MQNSEYHVDVLRNLSTGSLYMVIISRFLGKVNWRYLIEICVHKQNQKEGDQVFKIRY